MADLPPPGIPAPPARRPRRGFLRRSAFWRPTDAGPIAVGVLAAIGVIAVAAAAAPLATAGWTWVWSRPHAGHVLLGAVGTVLLGAAVAVAAVLRRRVLRETGGPPPSKRIHLAGLIAAAWAVVVGVVLLLVGAVWWAMGAPAPRFPTELSPRSLDAIATRAFAVVAGLGGAALLVINYRRQRTTEAEDARAELAAARDDTRLFTERFTTASEQLGSDQAAVRLAGVHALAHLADDAPTDELVQMVIDVLCAYLRMPYSPAPPPWAEDPATQQAQINAAGTTFSFKARDASPEQIAAFRAEYLDFAGNREVRHTIIRVIGDRLKADSRWRDKNYDFTGVEFDGGDFRGAHFTNGRVSFRAAKFTSGTVDFRNVHFKETDVDFMHANFAGSQVEFNEAEVSGGRVDFRFARFQEGVVCFSGIRILCGQVLFTYSKFQGIEVNFSHMFIDGGGLIFNYAWFTNGEVAFDRATLAAGLISFARAKFKDAAVTFHGTKFEGGEAKFAPLHFGSPWVDFSGADFCGSRITFVQHGARSSRWASGPPPIGLLDAVRNAPLNTAPIPREWWEESDRDLDPSTGESESEPE